MKQPHGFTLIEVLLTISLLAVIGGVGVPVYASFQNRNNLDVAVSTYANSLRYAQNQAQALKGDSDWGVSVQNGRVVVFKGSSFASRDLSYDEIFPVSGKFNLVGQQEIVFSKFTGLPQSIGSLSITSVDGETRVLTINQKGIVQY